jgi:hypothetical protein
MTRNPEVNRRERRKRSPIARDGRGSGFQMSKNASYRMVLYSFGCGEVEVRLTGLLLSRSALREYKMCF